MNILYSRVSCGRTPKKLNMICAPPLPPPSHSCLLSYEQAAKTVRLITDGDDASVASFFTAVFDEQDHISNRATENMTQRQIGAIFASWATSTTGISVDDFNM